MGTPLGPIYHIPTWTLWAPSERQYAARYQSGENNVGGATNDRPSDEGHDHRVWLCRAVGRFR